jgi:hypothetical protein
MRLACIACLVFAPCLIHVPAHAHTFTVNCLGQADFDRIQAAVEVASSGDTIIISPCVYTEQINISRKSLVLIGDDKATTRAYWDGSGPTVQCDNQDVVFRNLTIARDPSTSATLSWHDGRIRFEDSVIQGRSEGWSATIDVQNSSLGEVSVQGYIPSVAVHSRFASVLIAGVPLDSGNSLRSTGCYLGEVRLSSLAGMSSVQDSIGTIFLNGGLDMYNGLEATGSTIDSLNAAESATIILENCLVRGLSYGITEYGSLSMKSTIVTGDCAIVPDAYSPSSTRSPNCGYCYGYVLEHNTFLGTLTITQPYSWSDALTNSIRSNIFNGPVSIFSQVHPTLTNNCVASSYDFLGFWSQNNLFADPQFCLFPMDVHLKSTSPCLGAAHDGGDIGALGKGCGPVNVRRVTWGKLKTTFQE